MDSRTRQTRPSSLRVRGRAPPRHNPRHCQVFPRHPDSLKHHPPPRIQRHIHAHNLSHRRHNLPRKRHLLDRDHHIADLPPCSLNVLHDHPPPAAHPHATFACPPCAPHSKHCHISSQPPIDDHRFPTEVATTTNPARPNTSSASALLVTTHVCGRSAGLLLNTNVTKTSRTPQAPPPPCARAPITATAGVRISVSAAASITAFGSASPHP